ncbi:MAG: epoxyqueuosine reductase [Solirubrobacterales bacterium]
MREAIIDSIRNTVADRNRTGQAWWREPLIGFAAASDPLFARLKTVIGPSHALPEELLSGAQTVVAYFLPFASAIVSENAADGPSSPSWARAYIETNRLIAQINQRVHEFLAEGGYESTLIPATHNFNEERLVSDWSHKHVAYIAGLGTFGVHTNLITEAGCAGRVGSLVTTANITADPRAETERCLTRDGRKCMKCAARCPKQALSADSFDRHRCYEQCLENAALYQDMGRADVCGKCISRVPCALRTPTRKT